MAKNEAPQYRQATGYRAPKIVHKGALKQFSGSPLGKDKGIGLPGIPGQ